MPKTIPPEPQGAVPLGIRLLGLGLLTLALSGCDWVGIFAKESLIGVTSHRGWDTFTFTGQLPAEFGIDAIAFYGAKDRDGINCQSPTLDGKTVTRGYSKTYTAVIQNQPQAFSFDIPLSYYKGLCGMKLGRVKLDIKARYGEQKWQRTYASGNFWIEPEGTSVFTPAGTLDVAATCSFTFQDSKLFGEISKFLSCKSSGASLPKAQLANKTVNLKIEVNPEEKPSMRNRWINTESGWKPCQETEKSNRCQSPPIFKTFKMNGKTCSVYPNCTE